MPEDIFDTILRLHGQPGIGIVIFTQGIALPVKRDRVMAKKILPWIKSVGSSKLLAIRSRLRRCSASA
jgi:hypothetical protein